MSDQKTDTKPPVVTCTPVHIQFAAVMSDGGVIHYELPVEAQDQAELQFGMGADLAESAGDDPRVTDVRSRSLTLTAKVTWRPPLDRPDGLYRVGGSGGAAPTGEMPGREVPDYVVAQIAQLIAGWSPAGPGMQRGTPAYAAAVRAQATLTAQRMWHEAYLSGVDCGYRMSAAPTRMMLGADATVPDGARAD